jgi:hypothetical protein
VEGGYAWWWEVVVQGRVSDHACIVEAEATSDECFHLCTCTYRCGCPACECVSHSTSSHHQRSKIPALAI